jgi:hypothetical protein
MGSLHRGFSTAALFPFADWRCGALDHPFPESIANDRVHPTKTSKKSAIHAAMEAA